MLRILILGNIAPYCVGGAEVQARRLAESFAGRGHQVTIAGYGIPSAVHSRGAYPQGSYRLGKIPR